MTAIEHFGILVNGVWMLRVEVDGRFYNIEPGIFHELAATCSLELISEWGQEV